MKILFADALPESHIDILRQRGDECVVEPDIGAEISRMHLKGLMCSLYEAQKLPLRQLQAATNSP